MSIAGRVAVGAVVWALAMFASTTPSLAGPGDAAPPPPLTLCLAAAADGSPVYPLDAVPSNHRELTVAFHLGASESFQELTQVWTAVDVGDVAPAGTEVQRAVLPLKGAKHGTLRFTLPRDLPVGTYRLDVAADGKPWAKLAFSVGAPSVVVPLEKPEALLPLTVGTTWTHAFSLEVGAIVKKFSMTGADRGADGLWRATATYTVAAKEDAGARVEIRRKDVLVNEEWWALDASGLGVSRERSSGETRSYDPPVPMVRLPFEAAAAWTYKPKDGSFEREYRMWGPLPVLGPKGPTPGYVVLYRYRSGEGDRFATTERHVVPGVGIVREVQVDAASGKLVTRIETKLLSVK